MEPNYIYATRQGNLNGEVIEMSVDEGSMAHILSVLTDLYSDPTMAVIREYSTNARDAMIEAGNGDQPIEVSLPNAMSPFFKVRDYGVGLSVEDIRNIYSKYGASTKRSTNEQVGMLGLGCKSALTYTQQFTVRSVKDGQLVLVAISRTEDGSGVMEVVHTSDTDEKNGVEISVPVNRSNDFSWKANDFFRFWEPGTVLIDGQAPKSFKDDALQISDNLFITKKQPTDYIVMGNVAYRVNSEHPLFKMPSGYSYYGRSFGVIAIVPIGSVNFTPSREDLHYTKHTLATIESIRVEAERDLLSSIQREVDSQSNAREARVVAEKWNETTRNMNKVTYKGKPIPTSENIDHLRYSMNWGRGSVESYGVLGFAQAEKYIFVDGYEKPDISTAHRAKFRLWAEKNNHRGNMTFVVTKDKIDTTWFIPVASVSWDEVFKCRPERTSSKKGETYYSIRSKDMSYDHSVTELPKGKTLVLWSRGDKVMYDIIASVVKLSDDAVFVNLPKNRWDKFIRENAGTLTLTQYVNKMMNDAVDNLSEDDVICITMHYDERASFGLLDESKIDDPELARKIRNAKINPSDVAKKYIDVHNLCRRASFDVKTLDKSENMLDRYPLIRAVNGVALSVEHCYAYANAIYSNK